MIDPVEEAPLPDIHQADVVAQRFDTISYTDTVKNRLPAPPEYWDKLRIASLAMRFMQPLANGQAAILFQAVRPYEQPPS